MAKGLRSKSQLKYRNVRRENLYGPQEAERLLRLAAKQAASASGPSIGVGKPSQEDTAGETMDCDLVNQVSSGDAAMDTDKPKKQYKPKKHRKVAARPGQKVGKKSKLRWSKNSFRV
ncbi:hypothetical protein IWQ62_000824 [Dispira parvispora]|uniref:DUF2423 domain-containing protein n=1 Tax=Dispira parvispora TaxID=1520584 RepID=A0A9W8AWB1_9FUNG|nr:hypothetical protein IWQ62_000824 [Dispira parvispora]